MGQAEKGIGLVIFLLLLPISPVLAATLPNGVSNYGCFGISVGDEFHYKQESYVVFNNGTSARRDGANLTIVITSIPEENGYIVGINQTYSTPSSTSEGQFSRNLNYLDHEFRWVGVWDAYAETAKNESIEHIGANTDGIYITGETEDTFTITIIGKAYGDDNEPSGKIGGHSTHIYNKTNGVLLAKMTENHDYDGSTHSLVTNETLVYADQPNFTITCQTAGVENSPTESSNVSMILTPILILLSFIAKHKVSRNNKAMVRHIKLLVVYLIRDFVLQHRKIRSSNQILNKQIDIMIFALDKGKAETSYCCMNPNDSDSNPNLIIQSQITYP